MYGSENGQTPDRRFHLRRNQGALLKFLAAMDDAMAYHIDVRGLSDDLCFSAPEGLEHMRNHLWTRIRGQTLFEGNAAGSGDLQFRGPLIVRPICISLPEWRGRKFRPGARHIVQARLLAPCPRAQNENFYTINSP